MSATILYVKHLVDGRGAEGRPGPGLRLLHAFLRPVAYAGREDGLQLRALLRAERHLVIVHVDRLELALDDVDTERRARHQLGRQPDREQHVALARAGQGLRLDDLVQQLSYGVDGPA